MPSLQRPPSPLLVAAAGTETGPSRLDDFFQAHLHYEAAAEQLREYLTTPADVYLVLLVGPTGVGKSELVDRTVDWIRDALRAEMDADRAFRPVEVLAAPPTFNGRVDWAAFFELVYYATGGVALNRRLRRGTHTQPISPLRRLGQQKAIEVFNDAVAQINEVSRTQVLFVEEARPFAAAARSSNASDHADVLKAFAHETGCRLVLVGTYGLLALRSISSELSRRARTVDFTRYASYGPGSDFAGIAADLLAKFPNEDVTIDADWRRKLHQGTLGCVGTLIDWLRNAERLAAQRGKGNSFTECLRDSEWTEEDRTQARSELALVEAGVASRGGGVPSKPPDPGVPSRSTYTRPRTASGQVLNPGELGPRHLYLDPPENTR